MRERAAAPGATVNDVLTAIDLASGVKTATDQRKRGDHRRQRFGRSRRHASGRIVDLGGGASR